MAQITINVQKTALAALLGAITGVTKVHEDRPAALQPRELPAFVLVPGPARYAQRARGDNSVTVTRRWYARLYVTESTKGREFEAERAVDPFLTRVVDQLAQYPVVILSGGTAFSLSLDGGGDRGIVAPMPYADKDYAGSQFEFDTVTEEYVTAIEEY